MRHTLFISSFLVITAALICAAADDLAALKATLQKLCDANEDGAYGSCCASNNDGQDITSIKGLPDCFGTVTTSAGVITYLFAPTSMRSF